MDLDFFDCFGGGKTMFFPSPNNPKYLNPSFRMDLDFWVVLDGKKLSYNQINTELSVNTTADIISLYLLSDS